MFEELFGLGFRMVPGMATKMYTRDISVGLQEGSIFKWIVLKIKINNKARFGNVGGIKFLHKNMCT